MREVNNKKNNLFIKKKKKKKFVCVRKSDSWWCEVLQNSVSILEHAGYEPLEQDIFSILASGDRGEEITGGA